MAELTGASQIRNGGYVAVQDQQAGRIPADNVPVNIAIIGACEKGRTTLAATFNNTNINSASGVFGTKGDMLEQINEIQRKGLSSIRALRVGARSVFVDHIGDTTGTSGYRIECADGGVEWGTSYGIAYSTSDGRLLIQDIRQSGNPLTVFDNLAAAPIDYGLFIIEGTPTLGQGTNLGTASAGVTIPLNSSTAVDGNTYFYPGDNGTDGLSRMEIFQGVFSGLQILENGRYRTFAAPEKATLNAPYSTNSTATGGTAFPPGDASYDVLGPVFIEDIDGRFEYYWDVNSDGTAEFWSVNSTADFSTQSKGGINLTTAIFKVPNFAYVIAYEMDRMHQEVRYVDAVVGVEKPAIGRPLSEWYGAVPTFSTDIEGDVTVSANGSGVLGNKYVAGATDFRGASAYGGFIRTTNPFFDDGTELTDNSGNPIDIGKYLVLWATPEYFVGYNNVRFNRPYYKISPAAYAAWRESLPLTVTPTMQDYPALGVLTNRIPRAVVDKFSEMRITIAKPTDAGIKILDGPVASLPVSDYARQGTMRTVEFIDRALRIRADRYIGRYLDTQEEQSLQQEFNDVMNALVSNRVIKAGSAKYFTTPLSKLRGEAFVNVNVIVPFELRKITFSLSLTQG